MDETTDIKELYGTIREILQREGLEPAFEALRDLPEGENDAIRDLIADLLEPTLQYTKSELPAAALWSARAYARGCVTKGDLKRVWWECVEEANGSQEARIERAIVVAVIYCAVENARFWVAEAARAAVDILVQAGKTKSEAWGELELIFTPWLERNLSAAWQKGDSQ